MNMSPISLESTATAAPTGSPNALPAGAPSPDSDFAERLARAFAQQPAGQNLAAGMPMLQTLTLGPALEVLTTPADQPDGDSLAKFAKAQGLDDEVVAWLFSEPSQGLPGVGLAPAFIGANTAATGGLAGQTLQGTAGALQPMQPLMPANLATPGLAASPTAPGWSTTPAVPGLPGTAVASTLALLSPAMNWLQPEESAQKAAAPAAGNADAGFEPLAAVSPFGLSFGARSSAALGQAAGAPQPDVSSRPADVIPVQVLSLVIEPELEALWDEPPTTDQPLESPNASADRPLVAAGMASGAGQAAADDAPMAPTSTSGDRAEGYEALAQRVGEALAQRIQSQVERGQWQVRLLLKPAKLGEVEIDLTLRAGELDASFRATNPVTRDLLNDGLSRLREVLANAGMEIADLNVGSGRSQQHGGNPTPRQPAGASAPPASAQGPTASSAMAPVSATRRSPGSDWDVLV